jgi:hypothetical protein
LRWLAFFARTAAVSATAPPRPRYCDGGAMASSRAQQVLERVIREVPRLTPATAVLDSWTEGDDVFCLVYRQEGYDWPLGLRRHVPPEWTVDGLVQEILICELEEPLGSLSATLQADDAGVRWWRGNPPEWSVPR